MKNSLSDSFDFHSVLDDPHLVLIRLELHLRVRRLDQPKFMHILKNRGVLKLNLVLIELFGAVALLCHFLLKVLNFEYQLFQGALSLHGFLTHLSHIGDSGCVFENEVDVAVEKDLAERLVKLEALLVYCLELLEEHLEASFHEVLFPSQPIKLGGWHVG